MKPTRKQVEALYVLYGRWSKTLGCSYLSFRRTARIHSSYDPYLAVWVSGIYYGIEPDGHTHT